MKAMIIDGEELFRLALKEIISVSGTFTEIIEVTCNENFMTNTAKHQSIDLIMVNPSALATEGHDCVNLARRLYPNAKVVCITDPSRLSKPAGVHCTLDRTAPVGKMIQQLRAVLGLSSQHIQTPVVGGRESGLREAIKNEFANFSENLQDDQAAAPVDLGRLSFRQRQILAMAADGLPNKEIAARLGIAEGTVKAHMHAIFKVLGVSNRTQAVIRYGASGQKMNVTAPVKKRTGYDHRDAGTWDVVAAQ